MWLLLGAGLLLLVWTGNGQHEFNTTLADDDQFLRDLIKAIEEQEKHWKPKLPEEFENLTIPELRLRMGVPLDRRSKFDNQVAKNKPNDAGKGKGGRRRHKRAVDEALPASFDWRDYTDCISVGLVRNQGDCGSCWAVASAAAISDRYCIYTQKNRSFSSMHLVSCSMSSPGYLCSGGFPEDAMRFYVNHGIVSGGDPNLGEEVGCLSYPPWFEKRLGGDEETGKINDLVVTPTCARHCDDCTLNYHKDLLRGGDWWSSSEQNVTEIMEEIYNYGPVVASFDVYPDIFLYASGIYEYVLGEMTGRHAVKIIGWGIQDDIPYWIIVNSWGDTWGEDGLIRIRRDTNEVNIESDITSAYPQEAFETGTSTDIGTQKNASG